MAACLEVPASGSGRQGAGGGDDWNRWLTEALKVAIGNRTAVRCDMWTRLRRRTSGRRIALVAGAVAVLLVASASGWFGRSTAVADSGPGESLAKAVVIVHPGDSLWSVAGRLDPGSDRWTVISRIKEVNRLDGDRLRVGQELLLPEGVAK